MRLFRFAEPSRRGLRSFLMVSGFSHSLAGTPRTTFGDLARDHLEIEVTCEQCGSVGLPMIGKQRR
jgi:hypothetical protein